MGDTSDNTYIAFYNNMLSSDAAHYMNAIAAMDTNDLATAQSELNMIADTNRINNNHIVVGNIYLNTWAQGNYELTKDQSGILYDMAYLDPNTNGDAVYTARVILGIDVINKVDNNQPKPINHQDNVINSASIKVYPNPANDRLYIALDGAIDGTANVEFYDLSGKLIYNTTINAIEKLQTLNINSIKAGVYNLRITTTTKINNQKLVIIK